MDNSIDLLEKRVQALELEILPKKNALELIGKSQNVTELLLQTNTMITSALSCREAVTSILQHMNRINDYLDPSYGEKDLDVEVKRLYLLELYPELKDTFDLIKSFQSLIAYTNSENIIKISDLSDKLNQLTASNLNIYEENRKVNKNVMSSLQHYNDITNSINLLFIQLDKALSDMEH